MKILTVIAARGGSKGVKNKNIKKLLGKPLISYTIEQAKKWGGYSKFIISTDSKVIADVALRDGVEMPFLRPARLARDTAGKIDVLRHALKESEKYYGLKFDAVLDLDVTAPIRKVSDIKKIISVFKQSNVDCVFSVVKSRKSPYFNMVEVKKDGNVGLCKELTKEILRRQDAPIVYEMNTSLYVYKRDFLLNPKNKLPYIGKSAIYEMQQVSAVDIDSEEDFKFIEFLLKEGIVTI